MPWADRGHPGGPAHRADQGLRPEGPDARPSTSSCRTCAAARSARATARASTRPSTSGPARLGELFERYGAATILGCFDALPRRVGGRHAARRSARSPTASRKGEDWLDDDGVDDRPIRSACPSTMRGDARTFDFTGTGARGPRARQHHVLHHLLGGLLRDEGARRPRRAAQRRLLPAARRARARRARAEPAARRAGGRRQPRDVPARRRRLLSRRSRRAIPERVTAGGPTTVRAPPLRRAAPGRPVAHPLRGPRGRRGRERGARTARHAVRVHMSNVMNTPVEVIEAEYPLEIVRARAPARQRRRRRPSRGLRLHARVPACWPDATLTTMLERRVVPPWGAFGGVRRRALPRHARAGRDARATSRARRRSRLRAGDVVVIDTCGRRRLRRSGRPRPRAPGRATGSRASWAPRPRARTARAAPAEGPDETRGSDGDRDGRGEGHGTGDLAPARGRGRGSRPRRPRGRAAGGGGRGGAGPRPADPRRLRRRARRGPGPGHGRARGRETFGAHRRAGELRRDDRARRDAGAGAPGGGLGRPPRDQPARHLPADQARRAGDARASAAGRS